MLYYKVKTGFGADDYISIDETELKTAFKAQASGKIAVFNQGSIAGNHIISILPDYNRIMGWNRDYKLTGEDYQYIGQQKQDECTLLLENTKREIAGIEPRTNTMLNEGVKTLTDKFKL